VFALTVINGTPSQQKRPYERPGTTKRPVQYWEERKNSSNTSELEEKNV